MQTEGTDLVNAVEKRARRKRRRAADVVHQAAADEQDQRSREAIPNSSEEAEGHQQLVGGVSMHKDGVERTGRPPHLPLLRRPGTVLVLVAHFSTHDRAHTGRSGEKKDSQIRSHSIWEVPPLVASKMRRALKMGVLVLSFSGFLAVLR